MACTLYVYTAEYVLSCDISRVTQVDRSSTFWRGLPVPQTGFPQGMSATDFEEGGDTHDFF